MQFQVTEIHFDWGDSIESSITEEEMDEIIDETFSTIWEAAEITFAIAGAKVTALLNRLGAGTHCA